MTMILSFNREWSHLKGAFLQEVLSGFQFGRNEEEELGIGMAAGCT